MLIATLPTLVSDKDLELSEKILSHPLIDAVRYNTGGASPYSPQEVLQRLAPLAQKHETKLYIDLEGRQVRIANWSPFSAGFVTLNRDFDIELPGKIHFRRLGWFKITNADQEKRRIFFDARMSSSDYYLGESQSVHIVARKLQIPGYLANQDLNFIDASIKSSIKSFMLSFVESYDDLSEFNESFGACDQNGIGPPEIIAKIESLKGIDFVRNTRAYAMKEINYMAARDDLFLAHIDRKVDFLDSLKLIVARDPDAILASKIMSGLESGDNLTIGDLADMFLMAQLGYKNFMLSDELTRKFDWAISDWQKIIQPLLVKEVRNE